MPPTKSHSELICWQLADRLRELLLEHTKEGTAPARDWRLTTNLRDAIGSGCRNQAEGFYKFKHRQMKPFFNTARGSLGETLDCIKEGCDRKYFAPDLAEQILSLCPRTMVANLRFLRSLDRRSLTEACRCGTAPLAPVAPPAPQHH
jgi:four helix bundle protein